MRSGASLTYENGLRDYGILDADPMFASIRSDPAFEAIIERMRADVAAQRQRAADRGLLDLTTLVAAAK